MVLSPSTLVSGEECLLFSFEGVRSWQVSEQLVPAVKVWREVVGSRRALQKPRGSDESDLDLKPKSHQDPARAPLRIRRGSTPSHELAPRDRPLLTPPGPETPGRTTASRTLSQINPIRSKTQDFYTSTTFTRSTSHLKNNLQNSCQ